MPRLTRSRNQDSNRKIFAESFSGVSICKSIGETMNKKILPDETQGNRDEQVSFRMRFIFDDLRHQFEMQGSSNGNGHRRIADRTGC
jgi:hypothetical protein